MLHPTYIEYSYFDRFRTQTACLRSIVVCFSGCIACDLNQVPCFPQSFTPVSESLRTSHVYVRPGLFPVVLPATNSATPDNKNRLLNNAVSSRHHSTRQRTKANGGTVSKNNEGSSAFCCWKDFWRLVATGSPPHLPPPPLKAQCVSPDFGSLVSSVNSDGTEVSGGWRGSALMALQLLNRPPPTAPRQHLWSPLSMHQKGWLQTDKYYIYNMNIYSHFNGLLMDSFVQL